MIGPAWIDEALRHLPAVIIASPDGTQAIVHHACGADHPHARACRDRLTRKGVRVLEGVALKWPFTLAQRGCDG